jgi:hypothetical protein
MISPTPHLYILGLGSIPEESEVWLVPLEDRGWVFCSSRCFESTWGNKSPLGWWNTWLEIEGASGVRAQIILEPAATHNIYREAGCSMVGIHVRNPLCQIIVPTCPITVISRIRSGGVLCTVGAPKITTHQVSTVVVERVGLGAMEL